MKEFSKWESKKDPPLAVNESSRIGPLILKMRKIGIWIFGNAKRRSNGYPLWWQSAEM
jgi:hypothetical protein